MDEFLCVKIRSSDPYERGVQYGRQARDKIALGIEGYKRHFAKTLSQSWEEILAKSHLYLPLLKRDFPEELAEARGIAAGSGADLDAIMALNCRYEILKLKNLPQGQECTSAAILPEATRQGGTFMIKNWDYRPWVERHAVIVDIDDLQGTHIVGLTEAGQLIRDGMNNHGVALCGNNLTSVFDTGEVGAPVTFVRRKALNCRTLGQAHDVIRNSPRGVSCNILVASAEGTAVDLETTPGGVFEVCPEAGVVTHANHMVAGAKYCTNKGSKFRDGVLRKRLMEHYGSLDVDNLRECLTDHEMKPGWPTVYPESDCLEAVCSHVPYGDIDEDKTWKTIASSIYDLDGKVAYICKGCPCQGCFVTYPL